jgi:hypothetical protein
MKFKLLKYVNNIFFFGGVALQLLLVLVYFMCGPKQLAFFQCGPGKLKGWTPLIYNKAAHRWQHNLQIPFNKQYNNITIHINILLLLSVWDL